MLLFQKMRTQSRQCTKESRAKRSEAVRTHCQNSCQPPLQLNLRCPENVIYNFDNSKTFFIFATSMLIIKGKKMKKNDFSHYVNERVTGYTRRFAQIAIFVLLCANFEAAVAADPAINVTKIAPFGENGYAEGKVVWDNLASANANQYAVIAMLHAVWEGGSGYFVKPYANNYLNSIDLNGNFKILITTGGIDNVVDEVIFYFVERSKIRDADIESPRTMANKYLTTKTVYRKEFDPNK